MHWLITQFRSGGNGSHYSLDYNSTWFLRKIISANLTDTIEFVYTSNSIGTKSVSESQNCFLLVITGPMFTACNMNPGDCNVKREETSTTTTDGWDLDAIFSCNSTILFHRSPREDMKNQEWIKGYRLDSIDIFTTRDPGQNEVPFKRFTFNYSYRVSTPNLSNYLSKRLFLERITEVGFSSTGSKTKPPYIFSYDHADNLPPRDSKDQDHWGYYNHASNTTMIPAMDYNGHHWEGANRETNPSYTKYGTLNNITYPTGGNTAFEFEANDALLDQSEPIFELVEHQVGTYGNTCTAYFKCTGHEEECCNSKTETFTADATDNNAFLIVEMPKQSDLQLIHETCWPYVWIGDDSNPNPPKIGPALDSVIQTITPYSITNGTQYTIGAFACKDENITAFIKVTYHKQIGTRYNQYVGGTRIAKITDNTGNQPVVRHFIYADTINPSKSTGKLNMKICYAHEFNNVTYIYSQENPGSVLGVYDCLYLRKSASTLWALGVTGGDHIGYSMVTELLGDNGENGKVIYHYSQFPNNTPPGNYTIPPTDESWRRGQLLVAITKNNQNQMVKKLTNTYSDVSIPGNKSTGYIVNTKEQGAFCDWIFMLESGIKHESAYYYYDAGYRYLNKSITTHYFPGSSQNPISEIKEYSYDPNLIMLRSETNHQSDGSKLIKKYFYPPDYKFNSCEDVLSSIKNNLADNLNNCRNDFNNAFPNSNDPSTVINNFSGCLRDAQNTFTGDYVNYTGCVENQTNSSTDEVKRLMVLKSQNNINPIIEEQTWRKEGNSGSEALIEGTYTEYKNEPLNPTPNQAFISKIYKSYSDSPIAAGSFTTSLLVNNAISKDNTYKPLHNFDFYTPSGNMGQYHKSNDINTTIFWGYQNAYPVIEGKNVTYAELNTAVTNLQSNFEAFLLGLGDLSDPNKRADWNNFNSSLRAALPQTARIVTYTYVPVIGMTSKTDENGIATYYYYDELGRLMFEKDDKNNIVKKYDYHYAGQ